MAAVQLPDARRFGSIRLSRLTWQDIEYLYGAMRARTLSRDRCNPLAYENNPTFLRIQSEHELAFVEYPTEFKKADVDARQELYRQLAEVIWDPNRLGLVEATGGQ